MQAMQTRSGFHCQASLITRRCDTSNMGSRGNGGVGIAVSALKKKMLQGEPQPFQWLTGQGRPVRDVRIEQNTSILLCDYIEQESQN